MTRPARLLRTGLAAVLLVWPMAGCSGEEPDGPADPAAASSSPTAPSSDAPPARYAVVLELIEQPSPPSGAPSSEDSSGTNQPLLLRVENTGQKADTYLLRLLPPESGALAPTTVRLAPGDGAEVRVMTPPSGSDRPVEVVAVSRAMGDVLATLELTD